MNSTRQNILDSYHAHVYFDESSQAKASNFCQRAGQELDIPIGRFHKRLVGPHPCWSCQLMFNKERYDEIIAWLEFNRDGLTVLVHGVSGDNLADHTEHVIWLGKPATLNLDVFIRENNARQAHSQD